MRRRSIAHLARLKLDASVLAAYPHELSGGMRQRATLALATICRPDFIIADEPTTALDVVVQKEVLGTIRGIQREIGSSVLFVTHDMGVHAHVTDRLGIMYAGRLVEEAATAEIFRNPLHPYTKHLISSLPRIGDDAPREGLEGAPPNLADPPAGMPLPSALPAGDGGLQPSGPRHAGDRAGASRRLFCCQRERAGMSELLLDVSQVSKTFVRGGLLSRQRIVAVNDVSFQLDARRPEIFAIIGESGSGKTTLSRMILNIETPTSGKLLFDGIDLAAIRTGASRHGLHAQGAADLSESVRILQPAEAARAVSVHDSAPFCRSQTSAIRPRWLSIRPCIKWDSR